MEPQSRTGTPPASVLAAMRSPYLFLAAAMLCWAGNWVVGRAVHATVPPFTLNFGRWLIALALILPVAARHYRGHGALLRRRWPYFVLMAAVGTVAYQSLVYLGLQSTTAVNGALINATVPVFVVAISWLLHRERLTVRQAVGIAVSTLGVVAIITRGELQALLSLRLRPGDLWILLAVPSWSLYTVLLRRRPLELHPMAFLGVLAGIGAVLQFPLFLWEYLRDVRMEVTAGSIVGMLYVGVFAAFLAFVFYNAGVRGAGPNKAGLFLHLHPVFTAVLAMVFLGERLEASHLLGIVLIATGIYLTAATRAFWEARARTSAAPSEAAEP